VTNRDLRTALRKLADDVRNHYGDRLRGIYLVDTRGLHNANEEGDAAVVVVLADGDWRPVHERKALVHLTYDLLLETELYIRALPMPLSAWQDPSASSDPASILAIKDRLRTIRTGALI
jgi:hypothetical protein